jgi:protease-4
MKGFLKLVLATIVGQLTLFFILVLIVLNMVSGLKSGKEKTTAKNSVLFLQFNTVIHDRAPSDEMALLNELSGGKGVPIGLYDLTGKITEAAKNPNIKGIFMDLTVVGAGHAKIEEIRNAIIKFKESGKFVYAYAEFYYNATYYLATAADKVFMNPQGEMVFNGLLADVTFYKGALGKLGVEVQVIKRGKFKGAVEPFVRENLSPENRSQITANINSIFDNMVKNIATSRKKTEDEIRAVANTMMVRGPLDAVKYGMVDALYYRDQVIDEIKKASGLKKDDKICLVKPSELDEEEAKAEKNKIAIVYASGDIVSGEGQPGEVGSEKFAKVLRDLRKDKNVKAVVLRIDSRGGSALASEVIWRETVLLKAAKPLIVSMSDVAASGGYYIACAADTIVVSPNTITGSIGVFGLMPNAQKLLNDKLGITSDYVGTGELSEFGRIDRPLTADEFSIMDGIVGRVYDNFIRRVSDGRGIEVAMVDSIGQGRVWTGEMAIERGLVDVVGGLDKAVQIAVYCSKLKKYQIAEYPKADNKIQEILNSLSGSKSAHAMLKAELGESYETYNQIRKVSQMNGVQALMPYGFGFK